LAPVLCAVFFAKLGVENLTGNKLNEEIPAAALQSAAHFFIYGYLVIVKNNLVMTADTF
jgi:hypothetical protein